MGVGTIEDIIIKIFERLSSFESMDVPKFCMFFPLKSKGMTSSWPFCKTVTHSCWSRVRPERGPRLHRQRLSLCPVPAPKRVRVMRRRRESIANLPGRVRWRYDGRLRSTEAQHSVTSLKNASGGNRKDLTRD